MLPKGGIMEYSLIVDIGNSQIEFAIFSGEELLGKTRIKSDKLHTEYDEKILLNFVDKLGIKTKEITKGIIFSVVPHITRLVQILIKGELGVHVPLFKIENLKDFKANIDDINEVGHDIIADIFGALHIYGAPCIISDLGTVTKNIIIDKDGVFQGVSFFPGLRSNARALSSNAAQLPELKDITKPHSFYGKNTIDAMLSGIYYGHVASISRFMAKTEEVFGYEFHKILTGGYSSIYEGTLSKAATIDVDLVLKGMNLILLYHLK